MRILVEKTLVVPAVVAGLSKLTTFLTEIGVIDDEHRSAWQALAA